MKREELPSHVQRAIDEGLRRERSGTTRIGETISYTSRNLGVGADGHDKIEVRYAGRKPDDLVVVYDPLIAKGRLPEIEFRSKLEEDYAEHLDARRAAGEILKWWYEPFTLHFAGKAGTQKAVKYRVDFLVMESNLELWIHETKGFFRRGERERLKLAAAIYPFPVKAITREEGVWREERF